MTRDCFKASSTLGERYSNQGESEMDNPLINLGDLSAPLTKLVEVIADGTGRLYAPYGTVRQAKADAKARTILAHADAEVADIAQRANARIQYREALRQENIESISSQAALEMPDEVSEKPVDRDWTLQYFDYAQDICDEDMQKLWARILAGEVSSPGSFSKRALQFLNTLDKEEAERFTLLCSFSIKTDKGWHYVIEEDETIKAMREHSKNADCINHFTSIGLLLPNQYHINPSAATGWVIDYYQRKFKLTGPKKPTGAGIASLEIEFFLRGFTAIGQELAFIAGGQPVEGYIERIVKMMEEKYKVTFNEL